MSEGARQKADGSAPKPGGAAEGARANPGRESLTGELADGDGLPYRQRSLFEASLGKDLSGVRVHTNDAAAEQADNVNARAFAVGGKDIVFAKGQYKPGTKEGDHLLAHEVAHTAQQDGAAPAAGNVQTTTPGDRAEQNADGVTAAMLAGKPAAVTSEPVAIARKRNDESIDVPPDAAPVAEGPAPHGPAGETKPGEGGKPKEGEAAIGELSAERVGQEELEGTEPIGPPQNLEGGKKDIAGKAAGLPAEGGADALAAGAPKVEGGGGGGGGEQLQVTDELKGSIGAAQADAQEAANEAKGQANAYKAEMKERRDRFDNEQQALTLEQLKTMSPADKRSTLIEMGYDKKAVKKMKDAELEGIISGRLETEARKTKILGMDAEELAALSPARKVQFLVDLGVDKADLDKIGEAKAAKAFDDVMRVAHVPGQHKVKVKIKGGLLGKSWEISLKVDGEGNADIEAKKQGGFLSKLWGWVKSAIPIILTVLAPLTGGASLIALAVYQTVTAIAAGDWLGAIIGAAGAVVGVGALAGVAKTAQGAATAFSKIAQVAGKVKNVAIAAKSAMMAAKAKSPGSLLSALAGGASAFADFAAGSASKFQQTMESWSQRLEKWSKVISGGERVLAGVKSGDPAMAIGGAFDTAAGFASKTDGKGEETSGKAKQLQRYSRIAGYASAGQRAVKGSPPDYGAVVESAMGIAGELKLGKNLEDATRITTAASRLTRAIQTKDPNALAAAAIGLAEAIHLAKYNSGNPEEKDADGKTVADDDREALTQRYAKATSIVKFASAAINAAGAKPRPNYVGALDAATQLIADLTDNKKLDQAAVLTRKFDAWTQAVQSKNEMAIIEAGQAFGEAINGMRDIIKAERDAARKAAEAKLAPGETLGADDGGDIPHFETTIDVVGQAPFIELQPPALDTTLDIGTALPDSTPVTPQNPRTGRESTPGANYTVIDGDTLSGIAQRFKTTVTRLRSMNTQLINDRVFVGQRLDVPGADVVLTPTVTTDEKFTVDPSTLAAADRAQVVRLGQGFVTNMNARIRAWRGENSLGADFYVYVRELEDLVQALDRMLDNPAVSADSIRAVITSVNQRSIGVQRLYDNRRGTKDFILNGSILATTIVRDGTGSVLSVLDRTRIISGGYQGVITAIDAYSKGLSPGKIVLHSAAAALLEAVPVTTGETFLKATFNQAFQNVGNTINEYIREISSKPGMTKKEKSDLAARTVARIGVSIASSPLQGALDGGGALLSNVEKALGDAMVEMFDVAVGKILGP